MKERMMTKEQSDDFERYMECVRGLDEDQVSRLAGREYETVQEMYEELKKEMLIKHERDQKRIAELKQRIAAKNAELARKDALKKDLESQILLEKAKAERLKKQGENSCKNQRFLTLNEGYQLCAGRQGGVPGVPHQRHGGDP